MEDSNSSRFLMERFTYNSRNYSFVIEGYLREVAVGIMVEGCEIKFTVSRASERIPGRRYRPSGVPGSAPLRRRSPQISQGMPLRNTFYR